MTKTLKFTKMHGCGNDFIMLNGFAEELPSDMGKLAKRLCDRHFSIGADGILALYPAEGYDFEMRIFQPDGSEAEMCGNGIRCAAVFAQQEGIVSTNALRVKTLAGLICPTILADESPTKMVQVDMGMPRLAGAEIPCTVDAKTVLEQPIQAGGKDFRFSAVSMGNPHAVIFIDAPPQDFPVTQYGPLLETHACFPAKANIEFAQVIDRQNINVRVWERGCGETLACGTGACATAVAAILTERADSGVNIHLPGGTLHICWQGESVQMTGAAEATYSGEVTI
jgi:diaminopimelate epimerase